jgi:hypothetical protein
LSGDVERRDRLYPRRQARGGLVEHLPVRVEGDGRTAVPEYPPHPGQGPASMHPCQAEPAILSPKQRGVQTQGQTSLIPMGSCPLKQGLVEAMDVQTTVVQPEA